jgi:hypothetical protein
VSGHDCGHGSRYAYAVAWHCARCEMDYGAPLDRLRGIIELVRDLRPDDEDLVLLDHKRLTAFWHCVDALPPWSQPGDDHLGENVFAALGTSEDFIPRQPDP